MIKIIRQQAFQHLLIRGIIFADRDFYQYIILFHDDILSYLKTEGQQDFPWKGHDYTYFFTIKSNSGHIGEKIDIIVRIKSCVMEGIWIQGEQRDC